MVSPNIVVARVQSDHPSGMYVCQGYKILADWQMVEDTPEVCEAIRNDANVIIASEGSREWCVAQGMEFSAENLAKFGFDEHGRPLNKEKPAKAPKNVARVAARADSPKEEKTQEGGTEGQDEGDGKKPAEKVVKSKAEVIAALVAKGKVEGTDFEKDAKVADLQAMLDTL